MHRTLHNEPPCSPTAEQLISECQAYRPDIIYCDVHTSTPFIEHLLRALAPSLVIAIGNTLPQELITIQLPQSGQRITEAFPFLTAVQ